MTSLSNECLNSINNINSLINDKEKAVSAAITEAYDKFFDMVEFNPNLITEGFLDSIPDRESGESILKTIFYFLPRLLKGIVNMLTNMWTGLRRLMMGPEEKKMFEIAQKTSAERLMSYVDNSIFKAEDVGDETQLYIKTRLVNYEAIMTYFDQAKELFQTYLDTINEHGTGIVSEEEFKTMLLAFSKIDSTHMIESNTSFTYAFSSSPEFVPYDPSIYLPMLTTLSGKAAKTLATINEIASLLEDYYESIEMSKWGEDVKRLAMHFRDNINTSVKEFQENNAKVVNEISETNTRLKTITLGITKCMNDSSKLDAMI